MHSSLVVRLVFAALALTVPFAAARGATAVAPSCSIAAGATLCLSVDAPTTTIGGSVGVSATLTGATASFLVFRLDGDYLLADSRTPYGFTFDTTRFVDGPHDLVVEAVSGSIAARPTVRATLPVTLANGVLTPPAVPTGFTPRSATPAVPGGSIRVVAVGDALDGGTRSADVARLVAASAPDLVLYLGDVYEGGSIDEFSNWADASGSPTFGQFRGLTNPTIGNHEYDAERFSTRAPAPVGYRRYWGTPPDWYSVDANGWHLVSLNSNCPAYVACTVGSPQYTWLADDLARAAGPCTLAFDHHPRWSTGSHGPTAAIDPLWRLLAGAGAELLLSGHDHSYQRFQALDAAGALTPGGVTQFVVGTGGHGPTAPNATTDGRQALAAAGPGVLQLDLSPGTASWAFVTTAGLTLDAGSLSCSDVAVPTDTTPPSGPATVSATATAASITLQWSTATDANGVTGYRVLRDGSPIANLGATATAFVDTTVSAATTYTYRVVATDAAGNVSSGATATITTPAVAVPTVVRFRAAADAFVAGDTPTRNTGTLAELRADAVPLTRSYLRFSLTGLAGRVSSAVLRVYVSNPAHAGVTAHGAASTWAETQITYANAPGVSSAIAASGPIAGGPRYIDVPVTPLVTGNGDVTVALATASSTRLSLRARTSTTPPELVVTTVP